MLTLTDLPTPRGKLTLDAPLGDLGWFKCGGRAEALFRPAGVDDLIAFLQHLDPKIHVHTFGVLSNTIIRDGGLPGVTIRLGREFNFIEAGDLEQRHPGAGRGPDINLDPDFHRGSDTFLNIGAATLDSHVAQHAADNGLSGLAFLNGIPGTIGGAIRMNAGATGGGAGDTYGQTSMRDVIITATAIDRSGKTHTVTPAQMHMTYRHNAAPENWIFTSCTLRAEPGTDPATLHAQLADLKEKREAAQPTREKTGGSTFANPSPDELTAANLPPTMRTWQLIDQAGCRGLTIGGAMISDKHCNFMINTGTATAADLETLGETVRTRVADKFGITLRWEIKRLGIK